MNNILQNLEDHIIKNYNGIKIDYIERPDESSYWRYECNRRVKLSPEVSVGSMLCYSVMGTTREEACNKLYNAIKDDKESEEQMIKAYETIHQNKEILEG